MPHINELILLNRPVQETDTAIVETPDGTRRLAATAFRGVQGVQGLQGVQGVPGETGGQGAAGTASGVRETATLTMDMTNIFQQLIIQKIQLVTDA
ncbi:MAG: hypothetical protein RLZZ419_385 [Pseudomonadota bacterium]|jgi:hypothetical protein